MKTETKNLDKCQVQLTVTLDANEVSASVKDVEKMFVREARLPGFRPGKIPLALIRKNFATELKSKISENLLEKHAQNAIKEAKLEDAFVAYAGVDDVKEEANGGTLVFKIEVRPTFKTPTYKGLKIAFNDATVKDEEVQEQLTKLRESCAKYEDAKEGDAVKDGDFVQIDYTGTIDGKPITELAPDAKFLSAGTGFWTQVAEGRFVPEVLDALKGMKAGETKSEIKAKFGKDFITESLRGKKAVYSVTLKSFRVRHLPDDAAFLETLKPQFKEAAESLEKLTAHIREQMQKVADNREQARREQEALDMLLKKVDFDVPASTVRRMMNSILQEVAQRAQYSGLDADYFEKNREKILKDAEEQATKQVRLYYVLDAIATAEKLEDDKDDKENTRTKKALQLVIDQAKK